MGNFKIWTLLKIFVVSPLKLVRRVLFFFAISEFFEGLPAEGAKATVLPLSQVPRNREFLKTQ